MDQGLYLRDAYLREFDSTVTAARPGEVELASTAFYPTGGGQPCDAGELRSPDGGVYHVAQVEKREHAIVHTLAGDPPPVGSAVHGTIDWALRYAHMRYHTCLHILSGAVFHRFGSGITGGQIYDDRARMDLALPAFDKQVVAEVLEEANRVVARDLPIAVRFLPRSEAMKDPSLVRVAQKLVPDVQEIRLIDIQGFDVQADGGTHVGSTREVGTISLSKFENKGTKNKRFYVTLEPVVPSGKA